MLQLATEFPAKEIHSKAAFLAQVVGWLRGNKYSTVLEASEIDLGSENASLRSSTGEELRLRVLSIGEQEEAYGFRHDFPDTDGRLWRTEAVLRRGRAAGGQDLVRLRTQCLAVRAGARIESPRKPFLIKALLNDGKGGVDGLFDVCDRPHWIDSTEDGLLVAQAVTEGNASQFLPVIYVSAVGSGNWLLSREELVKLAYDLGGIAHVVVEPDRAFSFQLRELTNAGNAYGGTLAIALPGRGFVRRFYLGVQIQSRTELVLALRSAALEVRSQMPATGWDWTELQEQALRKQRERDSNLLSTEENERLYQEEIANLQDRVRQLEVQIEGMNASGVAAGVQVDVSHQTLSQGMGPEIYPGEFSDRQRLAAKIALEVSEQKGLDRRSTAVLRRFLSCVPPSPALSELLQDLSRASRDPKRIAGDLTLLLGRHGYREKADNKHVRLEASDGYYGLDAITLPKTPSESRGLTNLRKQIERTLGLTKLSED